MNVKGAEIDSIGELAGQPLYSRTGMKNYYVTIVHMISIKIKTEGKLKRIHILDDGIIVGYCYLSFLGDTIYLDILNILHRHQGKGYGTKFIEYLSQYGNIEGEYTYNSKGFYEKVGAKFKGNNFYINCQATQTHKSTKS